HLPAGLQSEHPIDAVEFEGEILEALEPPHIRLERLTTGTGAGGRDGVGCLHDHGQDRAWLDLVVMGLDAVDYGRVLSETPGDLGADQGVRAFDLVSDRLADVVQQSRTLHGSRVDPELGRQHRPDVSRIDEMIEYVLPVRSAELEAAEECHQLGVHPGQPDFQQCPLPRIAHALLYLVTRLVVRLFDRSRMDPSIGHEPFQGDASDLTTHRIERAYGY